MRATALSSESTWVHTIIMASHWVGLTLPGMRELPGSLAGRVSSPIPPRGPEASQRRSSAIFIRGTARPRSPAEAATMVSTPLWAAKELDATLNGWPVAPAISRATAGPNPSGAPSPVPTAVPPMAT